MSHSTHHVPDVVPSAAVRTLAGFSLVEVMITIGLLTVALGAMVEAVGNISQRQNLDESRVGATVIATQLAERIQSARWEWLGTDRLPWSYGRYLDRQGTSGARPPMTFPAAAQDDLEAQGLLPKGVRRTGLETSLEVYVEWYRGLDAAADAGVTSPGIFSATDGVASTTAFRSTIQTGGKTALDAPVKPVYRTISSGNGTWNPDQGLSPTAYLGETEPLAARIIVRWNASRSTFFAPGSIVLWVARSP